MGIYIKGMEMPKSPVLFCIHPDGKVFADLEGGWREYKAVPVPPHGRLADLDKIENKIARLPPEDYTTGGIRLILAYAPTIIPAEEDTP